jgi:squalene-hopene/tetraprenyl-beta-curcumene cyclase
MIAGFRVAFCGLLVLATSVGPVWGQGAEEARDYERAVARAIDYLRQKGQGPDGAYSPQASPAITALVTTAVLQHGRSPEDPLVAKSLKYLEQFIREDGGIYKGESLHPNYETCVSVLCFTEANKDGRYTKVLKKADAFLKNLQWDETEGKDKSDFAYGGAGYGNSKRPDLSNTSFLIDALKATGNDANSEAIQKALFFVSRCQNLESEHNTTPFSAKNPDGGFYYTPAGGGNSQAGNTDEGGLRSYASMTYAGLKSMIFAGLSADDPRVKAATKWLQSHYDLKSNPGMGENGLYYYYHTFGKALDASKVEEFVDDKGVAHRWRSELLRELVARQNQDGSWVNPNNRWLEGDPNLVTGYALLAIKYCKPKSK